MRALLILVLLMLSGAAQAQEIRIGYVDMKRVLDNAPQVIEGRVALDLEFRPINDRLMTDEARLLDMEQELASGSGLSAERVTGLQREIRNLERSIERRREDLAEELNFRRNQQIKELGKEIELAVETVAEREGFDLVLSSPVAYASSRIDITAQVLTFLETDYQRRDPARAQ